MGFSEVAEKLVEQKLASKDLTVLTEMWKETKDQ